jgi:hypothetical protein
MRCSRGGTKLLKFARAAIFTPDMTNSGAVLPRARGTRGGRARFFFFFLTDDPWVFFFFE